MREIPKKNYFIMLAIILSIIATTILLANIYNNKLKTTSVMYNYLSEIKIKDIDTYILEKPNTIIYISDKNNISNDKIEKKLKDNIIKHSLKDYFVFLNLNGENINYIDKLNKKYNGNIKKQIPSLIVFEEGKIVNIYYNLENIDLLEITGDIR